MSQKNIHHEAPKYNLKLQKHQNLPISPSICTPPFCDELPKGNQGPSLKGGGGVDRRTLAKSARKAWNSVSTPTKSCPCATSNILCKEASLADGGSIAIVGSTYASAIGSLKEEGWAATPVEDYSRAFRASFHLTALYLRNVAPMRAIICMGSDARKSSNPKCNKILWIKTGKNRTCKVELLLWTSTKEWMKRVGKLIRASVTKACKNAHISIGMVCK